MAVIALDPRQQDQAGSTLPMTGPETASPGDAYAPPVFRGVRRIRMAVRSLYAPLLKAPDIPIQTGSAHETGITS